MNETSPDKLMLAAVGGVLFGAAVMWFVPMLWQMAGDYDAAPRRQNVKFQLMQRKSNAMHRALDAIVDGRLDDVEAEAADIRQYAIEIKGYLATEVYKKAGEEFYESLDVLEAAAGRNDRQATKQAILRLENSCIDCHYLIKEPEQQEASPN